MIVDLTEEERLALLDATSVWLSASHMSGAAPEEETRAALRTARAKLAPPPSVEKKGG